MREQYEMLKRKIPKELPIREFSVALMVDEKGDRFNITLKCEAGEQSFCDATHADWDGPDIIDLMDYVLRDTFEQIATILTKQRSLREQWDDAKRERKAKKQKNKLGTLQ